MNSAAESAEEARRKLQRELDGAVQRERQKEEEKERVERQRERLREEIEDMTLALQKERQNCSALEKRQKKFDQVSGEIRSVRRPEALGDIGLMRQLRASKSISLGSR